MLHVRDWTSKRVSFLISAAISRSPRLRSLICLCGAAFIVSGCATASQKLERKLKVGESVSRVFFAKYEDVESALKIALLKYPQRVDNTEAGIFETDYVKGEARFRPAHENVDYSSGYRYRLIVRLVKGQSVSRPAVKVVILKHIELARDFFAEPQIVPSDGFEENVILYRVGRELTINRAIQKAGAKSNQQDAVLEADPEE